MRGYAITVAASARKELHDLPAEVVERIVSKIRELAVNPRPPGCTKLRGYQDHWRIRIGRYRVVYTIDDSGSSLDITRIAHRRDVYR